MKIAFLTPEYPHHKTGSSGGIGTSIKNLSQGLVALGCKVSVLVYEQKNDGFFYDVGISVYQIKNIKVKGLSWFLTRKKIQKKIDHLYNNQEIELIEIADWTGISSFISPKKCPIVIKLHGSDTYFCDLEKRRVKKWNRFHEKRALQKANFHVSVSQFTADRTNEIFGTNFDFKIIHNGINGKDFKSNGKSKPNQILYFGSLIRKKGMLELPRIFNELYDKNPKATLFLVGKDVPDIATKSASTWALMQKLFSEKAAKNVSYLDEIPYQDIQKMIQESTVCIFPSFAEAFPVSWLEAMAMQKPIVASNIGWAVEVISDGIDGLLENPKNHDKFAEKINILLINQELNIALGRNANQKIGNYFDSHIIAKINLDFYKNCIDKDNK